VTASLWLDDGVPTYELEYQGRTVLQPSTLGLTASDGAYAAPFTLVSTGTVTHTGTWHDDFGTRSTVPDSYTELTTTLESASGHELSIVLRAYDEGLGFRYVLGQEQGRAAFTIGSEQSTFDLVDDATVLAHPNGHQQNTPTVTPATGLTAGMTYARPLTVLGDGYAATITESDQLDYTRMFLTPLDVASGTLVSKLDGATGGVNLGTGWTDTPVKVDVSSTSFSTPWRTVVLGDDEGELLDHGYLVKSLAAPSALEDTSWVHPGRQFRGTTLTTPGGKAAVDFAAERNLDYVLFDAGWYGPEGSATNLYAPIANFDPATIGTYARSKGVKIILYVNYRALWAHYQAGTLDDWFHYAADNWGVGGIKFGFVPVGSQLATTTVYDWVSLAADAHLVVDIHDELLPTGVERTYPNLLTTEGVFGDEENPSATQDLTSLFTRGVVGPSDHTWCFMLTRNTSRSFRYASTIVWSTGLQTLYWYDSGPTTFNPAPELWDNLPAAWDETRTLEASVTDHATVARRSGDSWYIGAITSADRTATIDLGFLAAGTVYRAAAFAPTSTDTANGLGSGTFLVDSHTVLSPAMKASTGYALRLTPATATDLAQLPRYEELAGAASALEARIDAVGPITAANLVAKRGEVEAIRSALDALPGDVAATVGNQQTLRDAEATIATLVGSVADMQNVRLLEGATTFAREGTPADGNYLNAFDANPATYYDGRAGAFFGVHTTSPVVLAGIGYVARATFETRMIGNVIEGSNDGTTWTELYKITTPPLTNPGSQTAVMTSPASRLPYTYFRYAVGTAQFGNVADLEFFTAPANDYTGLDALLSQAQALHEDDWASGWPTLENALHYAQEAREQTPTAAYLAIVTDALDDALDGLTPVTVHATATPSVSGDAVVGEELTATTGAWLPSFTATSVGWERDGTTVPGATGTTYTLTAADYGHEITAVVTGSAGTTSQVTRSAATAPVTETTAPTVSMSTPAVPGESGWYTAPVLLTVMGDDDLSGVDTLEARLDDGPWAAAAAPFTLDDGDTVVSARSTDRAGNVSDVVSERFRVDATAPVSAARLDPQARTLTLVGADATSGLAALEYRVASSTDWQTWSAPLDLGPGATTIAYRGRDVAGNVEPTHVIDVPAQTAPVAATVTVASVTSPAVQGDDVVVSVGVAGTGGEATGTVTVLEGSTVLATGALVGGRVALALPSSLAVGPHHLRVVYSGDDAFAASEDAVDLTVEAAPVVTPPVVPPVTPPTTHPAKARSKVTARVKVTKAGRIKVKVTVTSAHHGRPTGKVTLLAGKKHPKKLKKVTLRKHGKTSVTSKRLKPGRYKVKVRYLGSSTVKTSHSKKVTVRVR